MPIEAASALSQYGVVELNKIDRNNKGLHCKEYQFLPLKLPRVTKLNPRK